METDKETEGVRLWDLGPNSCRWPLGGPLEHAEFFCGAPKEPGSQYCKKHRKRAFDRTAPFDRAAHSAIKHDKPPFQTRRRGRPPKASG